MKPKDQRVPNLLLRRQRLLRGWSLQRLVDEICVLSEQDGRMPGVNVAMVSCWEMGKKKPSPFYQERLCRIFSLAADQLGFMDALTFSSASDLSQPAFSTQTAALATKAPSIPLTHHAPREHIQAIDLLIDPVEHTPEEQLGAWLTLGANHLSMLLDAGWSPENVLASVQVVLQGVQGLPAVTRRKLLELGASALISGVSLSFDSQITESERGKLAEALGKSIGDGWKLFHTIGNSQTIQVSNTLLTLIKQHHYHIYPTLLPVFYSAVYRLKGAALYFQGHSENAWKVLEQSYLAALDGYDTWNMAQSRSWQAYIYNAEENYTNALQATRAALHFISHLDDTEAIRLRARLLAFGAKNAAMLGDIKEVQERLDASKELLKYLPLMHEEFDRLSWFQEAGICALQSGQYELAADQLQLALATLPTQWILRYVSTSIPLAITQIRLKQVENALAIFQKTLPIVKAAQSVRLAQEFIHCLQFELAPTFPHDRSCQSFVEDAQRTLLSN